MQLNLRLGLSLLHLSTTLGEHIAHNSRLRFLEILCILGFEQGVLEGHIGNAICMHFLLAHPQASLGAMSSLFDVSLVELFAEVSHQGQLRPRIIVKVIQLAIDSTIDRAL